MILLTIKIIVAFFIGSLPFGIIICQGFGLNPPNTYGSKNIGASNVARQHKIAGFITLMLDAAKGYTAIKLLGAMDIILLFAVLGHCFSPLMRFNGGKGIATYGGALIALNPPLAATLGMIWVLTFVKQQKPAIASILICTVSIIYALIAHKYLLLATCLIIILRHKENVMQLQNT